MIKSRQANIYRYIVPINEATEGGSVTCLVITSANPRARARRVQVHKVLRQHFNVSRKVANQFIRMMDFRDLLNFA